MTGIVLDATYDRDHKRSTATSGRGFMGRVAPPPDVRTPIYGMTEFGYPTPEISAPGRRDDLWHAKYQGIGILAAGV